MGIAAATAAAAAHGQLGQTTISITASFKQTNSRSNIGNRAAAAVLLADSSSSY